MTKLTDEQEAVLGLSPEKGKVVAVKAYAGCGKTFILRELSKLHKTRKILYLVFNKAAQEEARRLFPMNVDVRTVHSLAFQSFGRKFARKLGNLRAADIVYRGGVGRHVWGSHNKWILARIALVTFNNFLSSADDEPSADHFPRGFPLSVRDTAVSLAKHVWNMRSDDSSELPVSHDVYLKEYQLSSPRPDAEYDVILIDEAQDFNPTMLGIFKDMENACTVFVGDPHQQIYQFRNSVDAFGRIAPHETYRLSHSFRFGSEIAETASAVLRNHCGETVPLTGSGPSGEVREEELSDVFSGCRLHRSNGGVFENCWRACEHELVLEVPRFPDLNKELRGVYALKTKDFSEVKSEFLGSFRSFDDLRQYAETVDDKSLTALCRTVSKAGSELPSILADIESRIGDDPDVTVSTAHGAKGLEYDKVSLGRDFVELLGDGSKEIERAEANLLYVAVTRAKRVLALDPKVSKLITSGAEPEESEEPPKQN